MNLAIELQKHGELYHFKAAAIKREDGKNEYFPLSIMVAARKQTVIKKGMKAVNKYLEEGEI